MRPAAKHCLLIAWALAAPLPAQAQNYDDAVKPYAVTFVKTPPFQASFVGHGVYLGEGKILSAAHVVGRWPAFTDPRIITGDLNLPAQVVKAGSSDTIDVTLLSVDETLLPLRLRLRRNPLCKTPPIVGEEVFAVTTDRVVRSHILSPQYVSRAVRTKFNTLITEVATPSGSGIFRASSKCLHGIMSRSIQKFKIAKDGEKAVVQPDGVAGYFVPAAQILEFLPEEYRF